MSASPGSTRPPSTIASSSTRPIALPLSSIPETMLADLGDLAAGDLDPGELGAAAQADADRPADLRVGLARRG